MSSLDSIAARVLEFIAAHGESGATGASEEGFARLALELFAVQYEHNRPYRAFCDRRGKRPESVRDWREVPAVPTSAFKAVDLACAPAARVFHTSGTTAGESRRGRHLVPRPDVYRAGALAHFAHMVLPDGARPRLIGLLGGPETLPHSSLTQMVEWLREDLGGEYLVDERGFDPARAVARIRDAARTGEPLCLIGWRVAFTQLLDHCRTERIEICLPPDSRVVDTGGSKGGRALSDHGFLAACWTALGVPSYLCVNEYGMTELCSQLYDDVLRARFDGENRPRRKRGPAWLRTRALDPTTLAPVADGEPGLLCHFDLANVGSVAPVQTEDVGIVRDDGVELAGRLPGAEPRGCALALADLLAAAS